MVLNVCTQVKETECNTSKRVEMKNTKKTEVLDIYINSKSIDTSTKMIQGSGHN